jgi:hypothetical protein
MPPHGGILRRRRPSDPLEQSPRPVSFLGKLGLARRVRRAAHRNQTWRFPMRSLLLWAVGVPIPVIILLWFFMR